MSRGLLGLIGGVIGGLVKLGLDQLAFVTNIATINPVGWVSRILAPTTLDQAVWAWVLYAVATGLIGWLVAVLLPREYVDSYLASGIVLGAVLWTAMNLVLLSTRAAAPTWSLGTANLLVNLLTHMVLGIIIIYSLYRYRVTAVNR